MTSHHQQIKMIHHFKARIEEHIKKDNNSHIFQHLEHALTHIILFLLI